MSATTSVRAIGLHHQGLTVSDVERTASFYEDVFGAERVWELELSGPDVAKSARVPGADIKIVFISFQNAGLELFQYRKPDGRPYELSNNDVGATHVCIEVDDIDAAYERLCDLDITCFAPPKLIEGGPVDGVKFFFFADPDGLAVELYETPTA